MVPTPVSYTHLDVYKRQPFTHVRVNTVTDYGVHLGAYVETKNSNFARGNTVSHQMCIRDRPYRGRRQKMLISGSA